MLHLNRTDQQQEIEMPITQDSFLAEVNATTRENPGAGHKIYGPWLTENGLTYRTIAVFTGTGGRYKMENEFDDPR